MIAAAPGAGLQEGRVGPGLRFGQGKAADPFARGKFRQEARLLVLGAYFRIGTQPTELCTDMMVEQAPSAAAISCQRIGQHAGFRAAIGLGDQHAQKARSPICVSSCAREGMGAVAGGAPGASTSCAKSRAMSRICSCSPVKASVQPGSMAMAVASPPPMLKARRRRG